MRCGGSNPGTADDRGHQIRQRVPAAVEDVATAGAQADRRDRHERVGRLTEDGAGHVRQHPALPVGDRRHLDVADVVVGQPEGDGRGGPGTGGGAEGRGRGDGDAAVCQPVGHPDAVADAEHAAPAVDHRERMRGRRPRPGVRPGPRCRAGCARVRALHSFPSRRTGPCHHGGDSLRPATIRSPRAHRMAPVHPSPIVGGAAPHRIGRDPSAEVLLGVDGRPPIRSVGPEAQRDLPF